MAYRLVAVVDERVLRFVLQPGEQILGSSPECAVRLPHPTVSRRHAALTVDDDGVWMRDLGSRNGTRLEGRAVSGRTLVPPGVPGRVGSVVVSVEEVEEGEVAMGVALPGASSEPSSVARGARAPSTVAPVALESFALRELPALTAAVARGDSAGAVARAVGAALFGCLPCQAVRVERESDGAVLFTGERRSLGEPTPVYAEAGDGCRLHVEFQGNAAAEAYEPLVRAAAALVRAAGRRAPASTVTPAAPAAVPELPGPPSLVAAVRTVYAQAARVAASRVSVLICGESGTGKELLARYLHAASDRSVAPLVTLNCAALSRDLLEAELFGIEQGVATGVEARPGRFEAAHGGTLFLDEIGDMAPETQARILRALQEAEVYRVGGHRARPADVRVISATNRDLDAMLADGRFRRDLYHRIADWVVTLPPLRQRRPDIPNLAAHFLAAACAARGVRAAGISRAAVAALTAYDWPGNVRQLEKEMTRAALFLEDGELLDSTRLQPQITAAPGDGSDGDDLRTVLESAEREHLRAVLEACDGVVTAAAERLGIGVSTLYRRLKELGIERP